MSKHIRLLCKVGKELKPEEVEESVQKTVTTSGARSAVTIHEKLSVIVAAFVCSPSSFCEGLVSRILHVPCCCMPRDLNYLSIALVQHSLYPLFDSRLNDVAQPIGEGRATSDNPTEVKTVGEGQSMVPRSIPPSMTSFLPRQRSINTRASGYQQAPEVVEYDKIGRMSKKVPPICE